MKEVTLFSRLKTKILTQTIIVSAIIILNSQYVRAKQGYVNAQHKNKELYSLGVLLGGFVYGKKLKDADYILKPKPQFAISFVLNRNVNNNIALFTQVINQFWTKSHGNYSASTVLYRVRHRYRSLAWLFGSKYYFPSVKNFIPYIKAGIGVAHNRSYEQHLENVNAKYSKANKNQLSYLIGLGIKKRISDKTDWLLEYNYLDAGKARTGARLDVSNSTFLVDQKTYKIKNNYIFTGILYKL